MFERLSGEYNRGYTKAIQDIIEVFEYIEDDLRHHKKRMNYKLANEILNVCLANRELLRERIGDGFIRYNSRLGGFEYFEPVNRKE